MKFVDIKNDIAFRKIFGNENKQELDAYDYAAMRLQDERGKTTIAVKKAVEKAVEETVVQQELKFVENCYKKRLSIPDTADLTGL